jgi:hypothetical protein
MAVGIGLTGSEVQLAASAPSLSGDAPRPACSRIQRYASGHALIVQVSTLVDGGVHFSCGQAPEYGDEHGREPGRGTR